MATDSSILAWRIPWTEECGQATVHRVAKSQTRLSDKHAHTLWGRQDASYLPDHHFSLILYAQFLSSYKDSKTKDPLFSTCLWAGIQTPAFTDLVWVSAALASSSESPSFSPPRGQKLSTVQPGGHWELSLQKLHRLSKTRVKDHFLAQCSDMGISWTCVSSKWKYMRTRLIRVVMILIFCLCLSFWQNTHIKNLFKIKHWPSSSFPRTRKTQMYRTDF